MAGWGGLNLDQLRNAAHSLIEHATEAASEAGGALPTETILGILHGATATGGSIDMASLMPLINRLDTDHDGRVNLNDLPWALRSAVQQVDTNHDGYISTSELRGLITELGDRNNDGQIDMNDLPSGVRDTLISGAQSGSQAISAGQAMGQSQAVSVFRQQLQSSSAGRQILRGIDTNHDGVTSDQEVMLAWDSLAGLARNPDTNGDGSVNLDDMPAWVKESVLQNLDQNHDGQVDQRDLQPFLASLNIDQTGRAFLHSLAGGSGSLDLNSLPAGVRDRMVSMLDTNGDGQLTLEDLPDSLTSLPAVMRQRLNTLDTNHDGRINAADIPPDIAEQIIRLSGLDRNHDGRINMQDLPSNAAYQLLSGLDQDHNGKIELADALATPLGEAVLSGLDRNHDGKINAADLQQLIQDEEIVSRFDTNHDGTISLADLPADEGQAILQALAARHGNQIVLSELPEGTATELLRSLDKNDDGFIDVNDLPTQYLTPFAAAAGAFQSQQLDIDSLPQWAVDSLTGMLTQDIATNDPSAQNLLKPAPSPPMELADGGNPGLTVFLIFLFLGLFAGGAYYFYKHHYAKTPLDRRRLSDSQAYVHGNFPAELAVPLPSTAGALQEARVVQPNPYGNDPVVQATAVPV